jgi:hypothetical protein
MRSNRVRSAIGFALVLSSAASLTACGDEFSSEPPASVEIEPRSDIPAQLTAGDSRVVAITIRHATLGELVTPRATWRSSDESVLRVESVPMRGNPDSAAVDSLSARRTRVQWSAVGSGTTTVTVTIDAAEGVASTEKTFNVTVAPLVVQRSGTRSAYQVAETDTLRVRVLRVGGDTVTSRRLTWRTSDESVLRIESVSSGSAGDPEALLATNRLKVRLVARRAGTATVTAQVESSPDMLDEPAVSFDVTVAPLILTVVHSEDSLAVTQVDTVEVTLSSPAPLRLTWRTSDESRLRIEPLSFTGNAETDTLVSRRLRVRVVALQRGVIDLLATVDGLSTQEVAETRLPITVLPLSIVPLSWPDTLAVADSVQLSAKVVDAAGRDVHGLSIQWTSSDEASFALTGIAEAGRIEASARIAALRTSSQTGVRSLPALVSSQPSGSPVWGAALRRDSVRITLRVDGVPTAEAATLQVPIRVMERWVDLTVGFQNTCALSYDGRPYCWGQHNGGGVAAPRFLLPTRISSAFQDLAVRFRRLVGGSFITCGESASTPMLWSCWGDNSVSGLIGGAGKTYLPFASLLFPGGLVFRELALSANAACGLAIEDDFLDQIGTEYAFCWSWNSPTPTRVHVHDCTNGNHVLSCSNGGSLAGAASLAVVDDFACAIGPRANVSGSNSFHRFPAGCWGTNEFGQLGNDQQGNTSFAIPVLGLPGPMRRIAAANGSTCALSAAGKAYCWGLAFGPTATPVHPGLTFDDLSASTWNSAAFCGLTMDGAALCWQDASATTAPAPGMSFSRLRNSTSHTCGVVRQSGALYCWGLGGVGELGTGTLQNSTTPVRVIEPAGRP